MSFKEWFLAKELVGVKGMPTTLSSVSRKASTEGWKKKQASGTKGKTFEYHISSFPIETQKALGSNESDEDINDFQVILKALKAQSSDTISRVSQQILNKGFESVLVPERDERLLALLSDLNDDEFKEIFAFIRKAKYMLLAGLPLSAPADVDNNNKKQA